MTFNGCVWFMNTKRAPHCYGYDIKPLLFFGNFYEIRNMLHLSRIYIMNTGGV